MRVLARAVIEGCLGLGIAVLAVLLHTALRSALRQQDRQRALAYSHRGHPFGRKEDLKRPFFLSRSDYV